METISLILIIFFIAAPVLIFILHVDMSSMIGDDKKKPELTIEEKMRAQNIIEKLKLLYYDKSFKNSPSLYRSKEKFVTEHYNLKIEWVIKDYASRCSSDEIVFLINIHNGKYIFESNFLVDGKPIKYIVENYELSDFILKFKPYNFEC